MCTFASAQSTSSPFIQIFSVSCIVLALPPVGRRMVCGLLDHVHGLGARETHELARVEGGEVTGRAGADPDERQREQGLLGEDALHARQRERRDGAWSEAGGAL